MNLLYVLFWIVGVGVGGLVVFLLAKNSIFVVQQGTKAVVKRWGEHHRVLYPGFNLRLIFADKIHRTFSAERVSLSLSLQGDSGGQLPVEMEIELEVVGTTDDRTIVTLAYQVKDPEAHLKGVAAAEIRKIILPMTYDDILHGADELGDQLQAALQPVAEDCGFEILNLRITSIRPEGSVQAAIVNGARDAILRTNQAANADHANVLRLDAARAEADADAITAASDLERLTALAKEFGTIIAGLRASGLNEDATGTIVAALLHQETVFSLSDTPGAQIVLLPPGVPLNFSGALTGQPDKP